jgi:hypothetical protein
MRWFVESLDSWRRSMLGQWDSLGRRLPFEMTGSLARADSLGVSSSPWFQRGTNPNRNVFHYHRFDSCAHL